MNPRLGRIVRNLPTLLGIVLFVGAIWVVQKEFRQLKIEDIRTALSDIPSRALVISALWTVAAYAVLTFYDRLGTIYAGHPVSQAKAAFASFCAYALSHNLGFAAVSGAAVRYRLYAHWGLPPTAIARVIAFCSLTFGLGGMVLGGCILFGEPRAVPIAGQHLPRLALYAIGLLLFAIVGGYIALSSVMPRLRLLGHDIELPHWRMALTQVVLATVDVGVTAAIVYALLPTAEGVTYVRLLAVYLFSYTAGLIATLPGGLGVFDGAMLVGLKPYLPAPQILGAVLIFRLYYYIVPLFLAGSMFAGNEILMRGRRLITPQQAARAAIANPRWSEPDFAVAAGTGAVALCGFLLLGLGVLDRTPDYGWDVTTDFPELAQAGQYLPSLIGAALIVLAVALSHRVRLAWLGTMMLLPIASVVTWVENEPDWIPIVVALAILPVAPFRFAFYRRARLLTGALEASVAVPLFVLIGCVLALAAFERNVRWLEDNSFWEVILSPDVPNSLRLSVALGVALGVVALWRLVRPGRVTWLPWSSEARRHYASLGGEPPAAADGFVWGESERAGVPFRRMGRVMLALGDPAGAESDRVSVIWRLRDLAQQEGMHPAVWNAGTDLLKIYADLGLSAVPLGRDGLPRAANDPTLGQVRRYLVCVTERDLPRLLPHLPELANQWRPEAAD